MGVCNIDHSLVDVQKKLDSQKSFLPESLALSLSESLTVNQSQEILNDDQGGYEGKSPLIAALIM